MASRDIADNPSMNSPLILASTSTYRRELFSRLQIPFTTQSPEVDETPLPHESPEALALRLGLAKARAVAERFPGAVVIGSDQVADLDGAPIGKPGSHEKAVAQLHAMSGRSVVFQTAVAVVRTGDQPFEEVTIHPVRVQFRVLSDDDIEQYLRLEPAYDCAGSAKSEGLGITLLEAIESRDPTALIGLPLIDTCRLLRAAGIDPLQRGCS